jgi:hypothetical protein
MPGVFSHDTNRDLNSSNLFMKLSAFVYIQDKLLILKSLSPITELELSILNEFTSLCTVLAPRATFFYWHFYLILSNEEKRMIMKILKKE